MTILLPDENPTVEFNRSLYSSSPSQLSINRPVHGCARPNHRKVHIMKNSTKSLALAAAFAGLLGGTAVRVNAQPTSNAAPTASAGVLLAQAAPTAGKHSCKGKNDCKGQGGGKNAGKNSCKGKGNCATDGSKS
jgi:hypothetical protein